MLIAGRNAVLEDAPVFMDANVVMGIQEAA